MVLSKRKPLVAIATISPDFEQAVIEIYRQKLKRILQLARSYGYMPEEHRSVARFLRDYLSEPEEREKVVTMLRGLPYTEYGVRRHAGRVFLYGLTKDIVMDQFNQHNYEGDLTVVARWEAGPYYVLISDDVMLGGDMEKVHMIPQRKPGVKDRHPHHVVWGQRAANPIDSPVHTCMGGWGPLLVGLRNNCNIPELFRVYHIFLTRYNHGSPLAQPESNPEMREFIHKVSK